IVGEHNRENDLTVNITKEKHLTNIRSANKDQTSIVQKARDMSLEESIQYLDDAEYCEVTPKAIRLRKKLLDKNEREKAKKNKIKKALALRMSSALFYEDTHKVYMFVLKNKRQLSTLFFKLVIGLHIPRVDGIVTSARCHIRVCFH